MTSSEPVAALIIPHYNDLARLGTCLRALAPQVAAHSEVEVVVADNDSPVDLAPVMAAYPWARLVIEPARGAAAARNRGVAETTAPYLIFLDSDCVPAADWLAQALRLAPQADVTGGRIDTFDETPPPRSGAEAFEAVFAFDQKGYIEKKGFSVTANLLTSRAIFEAVGPFVVGVSEDFDWCQRAGAAGFALVYDDTLTVRHPTRSDWTALRRKWLRLTEESFGLKAPAGLVTRLLWALRAVAVLGSALPHAPRVLNSPVLNGTERWAGIATLVHLRARRMWWMLRQSLGLPIR